MMLRQVAVPDGRGGTQVVYVSCGPSGAVCGHGRPLLAPHGIGGGSMQGKLNGVRAEATR